MDIVFAQKAMARLLYNYTSFLSGLYQRVAFILLLPINLSKTHYEHLRQAPAVQTL